MVISLIGMSGAGKSTIGYKLFQRLKKFYPNTVLIDGDELRNILAPDLGHTYEDRRESEARRSKLCKYLHDQEINVVCAGLSNYLEWRQWCRQHISGYTEIYLKVPMEILIDRDSKGLYKQAKESRTNNVVGVDIEFCPPANPDLVIENIGQLTEEEVVDLIWDRLPVDNNHCL